MKPKWRRGSLITNPMLAVSLIMDGKVIFDGEKAQNPGWTQNWSISRIRGACAGGRLYFAHPIQIQQKEEAA